MALLLLMELGCYTTFSAEMISGTWTIAEFRFEQDQLGLDTAVAGKTFQYTFGTPPSTNTEHDDTGYDDREDAPYSEYEDSTPYSAENASDLWTLCSVDTYSVSFYCPIMPLLLHKDQWLPAVSEGLESYSDELCTTRSHYLESFVVSKTEIWTAESFTLYCWENPETDEYPPHEYRVSYSTRWTK